MSQDHASTAGKQGEPTNGTAVPLENHRPAAGPTMQALKQVLQQQRSALVQELQRYEQEWRDTSKVVQDITSRLSKLVQEVNKTNRAVSTIYRYELRLRGGLFVARGASTGTSATGGSVGAAAATTRAPDGGHGRSATRTTSQRSPRRSSSQRRSRDDGHHSSSQRCRHSHNSRDDRRHSSYDDRRSRQPQLR